MPEPLMTAEELSQYQPPHKRSELVRGRIIVREPASIWHGVVAARALLVIGNYVAESEGGVVAAAETGFLLERGPDTVRAPDVAYVSRERMAKAPARGFAEFAPELAVEVMLPDDTMREALEKASDWLRTGSELVWIINPRRRTGLVRRADGSEQVLAEHESFDGEALLPGLRMSIAELLKE
jgi:Uma2 family endonuclease